MEMGHVIPQHGMITMQMEPNQRDNYVATSNKNELEKRKNDFA